MRRKAEQTSVIMKKVARWEQSRTVGWLLWVIPSLIVAVGVVLITGSRTLNELFDLGVHDLIFSLADDFETMRHYVVDDVLLIWDLLPKAVLFASLLTIFFVLFVTLLNRRKIANLPRKVRSLRKYLGERR